MTSILKSVTLGASSVPGGTNVSGSVNLDSEAPEGGAQVTLACDPTVVTLPTPITIPEGGKKGGFSFDTPAVDETVNVTIAASYGGDTRSAPLEIVQPVTATKLTVTPRKVVGGQTAQATLTLSGAAHRGGVTVVLRSSNPGAIPVPKTVTVPTDQDTFTFPIQTKPVPGDVDEYVMIMYGDSNVSARLGVTAPVPTKIDAPPRCEGVSGCFVIVSASSPAPPGFSFPLSVSPGGVVTDPRGMVPIPEGQTWGRFWIGVHPRRSDTLDTTIVVGPLRASIQIIPEQQ
jgi:hypothetical protein